MPAEEDGDGDGWRAQKDGVGGGGDGKSGQDIRGCVCEGCGVQRNEKIEKRGGEGDWAKIGKQEAEGKG